MPKGPIKLSPRQKVSLCRKHYVDELIVELVLNAYNHAIELAEGLSKKQVQMLIDEWEISGEPNNRTTAAFLKASVSYHGFTNFQLIDHLLAQFVARRG
jgi:hypothetical protein